MKFKTSLIKVTYFVYTYRQLMSSFWKLKN